jgi:hypothetical protein
MLDTDNSLTLRIILYYLLIIKIQINFIFIFIFINILRNEGDLIYKPVLRFRTIKGKKDVIEDKIYEAIRQLPKLKKTNKKYIMIGYDDNYRLFSDKKSSDDFAKVTKPLSKYMFEVTTGDMNDIIPDDDE